MPATEPDDDTTSGTPIRAVPLGTLLDPHHSLLERLRTAYGGEEGSFEARLVPLIRRYAAFVHLLPATADAHFREPGGLLRLGLEVGLHAVHVADGQLFGARAAVTERRALAPRWRTAAFLAGMCAEIHRAVLQVVATGDDGARWCPVTGALADWLVTGARERYFVRWHGAREPVAAALVALPHLIDDALAQFLETSRPCLLSEVIGALSCHPATGTRALGSILEQTLARVVDRDLRDRPAAHAPRGLAAEPAVAAPRDTDLGDPLAPATRAETGPDPVTGPFTSDPQGMPASEPGPPPPGGAHDAASTDRAPPVTPSVRALSLPATLNPIVAEAITALFENPPDAGCVNTANGFFVPLSAFTRRGLDTGLVVGALHGAGLLVTNRGRKVRTPGDGTASESGILLTRKILPAQASLPFGR